MSRSKIVLGNNELEKKTVAIVGVGGTGSTVAQLLSRVGLKKLILIDRDIVEETNLERQILYTKEDIGKAKVEAAKGKLGNADIMFEDLNKDNINFKEVDLVIDCSDNVETRLLINDYCKKHKIPWIYTGAIARIGAVYFNDIEKACFSCFNDVKTGETCSEAGVLNTTVSFIGSLAAAIAVDYLALGKKEEDLIRVNLENNTFNKIKVNKNKDCGACNGKYSYLEGEKGKKLVKICSKGKYHFFLNKKIDLEEVKSKLNHLNVEDHGNAVIAGDFTVYNYGKVAVKADSEKEARKKYDKIIGIV